MNATIKRLLVQAGPFLGLLVVIGLFSIPAETREFFLTYHNLKIVLTQTVIVAIGALGMTLIIVGGGIDLSAGSSIAFTSVVGALLIQRGWDAASVCAAVILSGGVIGLLNGAAIAALRLVPFISIPRASPTAPSATCWSPTPSTIRSRRWISPAP